MVAAILDGDAGPEVVVLACGDEAEAAARAKLPSRARVQQAGFGDIWLRDTGPLFAQEGSTLVARRFGFNGWGGKYRLEGDETVGDDVAKAAGAIRQSFPFLLEGGAVEWDGEGTLLTTRQCLLNPNRNEGWDQARAEAALEDALGAERVLWLDEGLANDHTDGHIDNLARFVAPGHVVCQRPAGPDDPNHDVLVDIERALAAMTDARGRSLKVSTVPSPGLVEGQEGEAVPASHMNFLITNRVVVVPVYGTDSAPLALAELSALFPGRLVVGLSARAILTGGGAFHCITQQEPALLAASPQGAR